MLWLVEDDCADAKSAPSRGLQSGLDLYLRLRSLHLVRMRNLAATVPRCKLAPKCVSRSIELEAAATKPPKSEPFDIANDENRKKNRLRINFSAAC